LAFSLIAFCFGDLSYIGFFNLIAEGSQVSNTSLLGLFDFNYFLTDFFNYKLISSFDNSFFFHKVVFLFGSQIDVLFLIGLFLIIGAFAKSAQFGLHTWLPDAMEGPTPVSALIHAATMVTAGVFLMIRCAPLFVIDVDLSLILIIIGSITAFFGASVAASQFDIKKIIAYSTCSQLGYMMVACGVSAYDLAIFHLATHACFKAGLFLCAGLIIHSLGDEQDIRKMGGLIRAMPLTYLAMFICSFCLGGLPFFSGFYSKDAIMEASLSFDLLG
jgi:NADH:ubiquinone oxidoreductase subunit 5 (subunit L)/multisubunit Na+/H+ antiporter MnhA subunit